MATSQTNFIGAARLLVRDKDHDVAALKDVTSIFEEPPLKRKTTYILCIYVCTESLRTVLILGGFIVLIGRNVQLLCGLCRGYCC